MADEKVISLDEAREKVEQSFKPTDNENLFDDLSKQVKDFLSSSEDGEDLMQNIGILLAMPDKEFNLIAPLIIEELAKSYSRPEEQVTMAQMFTAAGITPEDIKDKFDDIIDAIDTEFSGKISSEKVDFLKTIMGMTYNSIMETQTIDKRLIRIAYELCHEDAQEPVYAHPTDAGMDVFALEDITINPGETVLVPTGIKMEIPRGYAVLVHPRSGQSLKSKLRIANSIGLIDSDYRGEIKVIIENIEPKITDITVDEDGKVTSIEYGRPYTIGKGQKFAQLRLVEVPHAALTKVDKVNDTERADGGFGSTGN